MEARARILITGLVQGVFFRREMTDLARRLGISGWVRNLPNGRVEALAEGEDDWTSSFDSATLALQVPWSEKWMSNGQIIWESFEGSELRNEGKLTN